MVSGLKPEIQSPSQARYRLLRSSNRQNCSREGNRSTSAAVVFSAEAPRLTQSSGNANGERSCVGCLPIQTRRSFPSREPSDREVPPFATASPPSSRRVRSGSAPAREVEQTRVHHPLSFSRSVLGGVTPGERIDGCRAFVLFPYISRSVMLCGRLVPLSGTDAVSSRRTLCTGHGQQTRSVPVGFRRPDAQ